MKQTELEISLRKASSGRWKSLESSHRNHGITTINSTPRGNEKSPASNIEPILGANSTQSVGKRSLESQSMVASTAHQLNDLDLGKTSEDTPHDRDKLSDTTHAQSLSSNIWTSEDDVVLINDIEMKTGKTGQSSSSSSNASPSGSITTSRTSSVTTGKASQTSSVTTGRTGQTCPIPEETKSKHRNPFSVPYKKTQQSSTSDLTSPTSGGQGTQFQRDPPNTRSPNRSKEVASTETHVVRSKYTKGVLPAALEVTDPSYRSNQLGKPSLTGLCNLGNSCFMNSIIQCLSNTSDLRDYFIDGRYLADINKKNPLGFEGELAKCFSQVVRKLWSGEYEYFPPKKLKSVVSLRSSHFGGYQQQDSHEFMSYLLDGLHEDLNRVKTKPQTPAVDSGDRPDVEVAEESWTIHRKRNDSYFVDNFQGQFKSTLVCPECSKVR